MLDFFSYRVGIGLPIPPLQIGDHPFKGAFVVMAAVVFFKIEGDLLFPRTIEDGLPHLPGNALKGCIEIDLKMLADRIEKLMEIKGVPAGPRLYGPLSQGKGRVWDDQVRIKISLVAQSAALRAGALRVVKGKHLGCQIRNADSAPGAGRFLAEEDVFRSHNVYQGPAV